MSTNKFRILLKNIHAASKRRPKLIKNTLMLYALQFSGYFFGLLTIPYQTRILGPEYFGRISFIASVMIIFQLFIDFGFMLHATSEVSKNRHDLRTVSKILTSVLCIKSILAMISILAVILASITFPEVRQEFWVYLLYLASTIAISFMPDFIYRGMESMTTITVRTIFIRFIFMMLMFTFLKKPTDYYIVPLLLLCGNIAALISVYAHMYRNINVRLTKVEIKHITKMLRESSLFFISRIATVFYGAGNTIILGVVSPGAIVGYYGSTDKLITTIKTAASPIADSLYPFMIKNKDYSLIFKIIKATTPLMILLAILIFIFADQICVVLFGNEFVNATPILRALTPVIIATLPNYLLGFPVLGAMGLAKHANKSIFVGVLTQVALILALLLTDHINAVCLALSTSLSELAILTYRSLAIYLNRTLMNSKD